MVIYIINEKKNAPTNIDKIRKKGAYVEKPLGAHIASLSALNWRNMCLNRCDSSVQED